jgi:hypothetical protein
MTSAGKTDSSEFSIKVQQSTDYSLLKMGNYNRYGGSSGNQNRMMYSPQSILRGEKRIERMKLFMEKDGGWDIRQPAIVWKNPETEHLELLDGQTRYSAIKKLSEEKKQPLPFYYTVNEDIKTYSEAIRYLKKINTERFNWGTEDNYHYAVAENRENEAVLKNYDEICTLARSLGTTMKNARILLYPGLYRNFGIATEKILYGCQRKEDAERSIKLYRKIMEIDMEMKRKKIREGRIAAIGSPHLVQAISYLCHAEEFTDELENRFVEWMSYIPKTQKERNEIQLRKASGRTTHTAIIHDFQDYIYRKEGTSVVFHPKK